MTGRGSAQAPAPSSHQPVSPADTSRMQQALRRGDYEAIGKESQGVRSRAENLQQMSPELPVQERLKLPLLNHMYRQGADMVDEGRTKQDESKIRYGMQHINEANERFGTLEDRSRPQNNERKGRGRKDR